MKYVVVLAWVIGGPGGVRTLDLVTASTLPVFHFFIVLSPIDLHQFGNICLRSKWSPFPIKFLHFWHSFCKAPCSAVKGRPDLSDPFPLFPAPQLNPFYPPLVSPSSASTSSNRSLRSRDSRENCNPELAYNAKSFVLCGIPLRCPPKDQLNHARRNGKFFLDITGHPPPGPSLWPGPSHSHLAGRTRRPAKKPQRPLPERCPNP